MISNLPPGLSSAQLDAALKAFATIIGSEWVLHTEEDRLAYSDVYNIGEPERHRPSAAISPATTEELQAVVRVANEYKVPLWPISRGKNMGYGSAAPRMSGTVILDLGRMRRILEVDVERGYCLIEPGVGFFDLYEYLQENNLPLWIAPAANAWGSVVGNALEHGFGYTPYGDNADNICGMEVVLPNGELVRTGMGAQEGSDCWQLFKYGYGPRWDHMFTQSNFGVVSKMGLWLMPEPESVMSLKMELPEEEDIGWIIDTLAPLRMEGIIKNPTNIGNFMRIAMVGTERKDWYQGEGALPEAVEKLIREKMHLGWWGLSLNLFGRSDVNDVHAKIIQTAMSKHTDLTFDVDEWHRGEPRPLSEKHGIPLSFTMQLANWAGPNGAHLEFSPVLPADGKIAVEQLKHSRQLFREHGIDYYGSFTLGERHINKVNMIAFDKTDEDMTRRVRLLFDALIKDAADRGYAEYRTHLSYMDSVAQTYNYNDNALLRLNELLKDAIDPNGIIAPGKQGIWPKAYRENKS